MDVGEMGMGWGLSTGLVQWYCADHFVAALARLSGLLEAARRSVAVRSCAPVRVEEPELELAGVA